VEIAAAGISDHSAPTDRTLAGLVRYFLRLGASGFGGPIALVGYMHRDLVEGRGWFSEDEYRQGLALAQTMPGPLAAQLAMWLGYLQRGALGAGAVAVAFVTPPFLAVTVVAVLYAESQGLSWVHAVFRGVGPVIVAIVAVAAVKLARTTNRSDPLLWLIAALVCAVTVVAGTEIVWVFLAAGAFGAIYYGGGLPRAGGAAGFSPAALLAAVKGLAWTGSAASLGAMGLFFLQAGAFTFGSGLAIVPFLHQGLVSAHHWLTEQQFVDAVAVGLISPGPVVLAASFGGYLIYGLIGGLLATVAVFLPAYLFRDRARARVPPPQRTPPRRRFRVRCHRGCGRRHRRGGDRHRRADHRRASRHRHRPGRPPAAAPAPHPRPRAGTGRHGRGRWPHRLQLTPTTPPDHRTNP